ncbi:hypothetical protein O0I10_004314 [Lichtheimia ornata]|uniref:Importin N-terminal domain-containing protein n=1 Tax=Lichtheimia ornata TaxID=688661 RepID=A0AAD7V757_9FUNG|nr:uncharacterized protein O0I10_004314 [Lichtheimia ornata]KAJ8660085.1 hypothetical protein O0I10_004314 [Lichtheimia ornata]
MADPRSQLLGVLHEATSQDLARIRQAEQLLKQWENEPHFFATLQSIFHDPAVAHDVRFLAGIYLKNGINRFWRKTAKNPINAEEKAIIRQRLLCFFSEPSKKLTAQNAVIVARIARMDYPLEWADLMPTLIQVIEDPGANSEAHLRLIHDRTFEMLYEVLYELSTRLLSSGRRQFAEVAPRIFQTVAATYDNYTSNTISELIKGAMANLELELNIVSMCVKCLRILLVSGIHDVHKFDETKMFITMSKERLENYMKIYPQLGSATNPKTHELIHSVIEEHGALYLALQKAHPVSCVLCPAWPDILGYYWEHIVQEGKRLIDQYQSETTTRDPGFEQLLLQGMLLIKDTIKMAASTTESTSSDILSVTDEEKALEGEARGILQTRLITSEFVARCAEVLVSQYMLLTPSDMENWEDDPEGFVNAMDSENWEFELRPCAEMTFMDLFTHHRDQLCPIILNLIGSVTDVSNYREFLFKDAVYATLGLSVQSIYGRFDFEAFLTNRLLPEISNKDPSMKVLHRRIAWLLGKWVNEGISADSRVLVYQGLVELLSREDMVVRLTAAHSLRLAVDDWDFEIGIFLPYLESSMDLFLKLLNQVEETDTIMKLISDLNAITDRTGAHMMPYIPKMLDLLAPYWSRAQEEPLFQSALVVTFTKITGILQEQSTHVHSLFLPIVQSCVDRNNKAHVYLLEDALDLWWTLLQTTPTRTPEISMLIPVAISLMDYDTECLPKVLKILESHLLLDGATMIQQYGVQLFSNLAVYVGCAKSGVASHIAHAGETALLSYEPATYRETLAHSGFLVNIIDVLLKEELYAHKIMSYMTVIARLAICDAQFLLDFLHMTGQQHGMAGDTFCGEVLDKWMDKFDNIGHPQTRKLHCIGLTSLLSTRNLTVLAKLPNIMAIWIDVLAEANDSEEDAFLYGEPDLASDIAELDESAEKNRKLMFRKQDPSYALDLKKMVMQTLEVCDANASAHEGFDKSEIDQTLLDQLNKLLA